MRFLSLPPVSFAGLTLLLSSCAAPAPVLSQDHPATTTAAPAPLTPPSATLALNQSGVLFAPEESTTAHAGHAHGGHESGHAHADHPHAGHAHASHDEASAEDVYTCPMHPEVTSPGPGRCPDCGMNLVKKEAR